MATGPRPFIFVDDERGWRGGQDSLAALVDKLHQRNVPLVLVTRTGSELERRLGARGVPLRTWAGGGELSPGSIIFFRRLLRELSPDLVFYNTPKPVWSGVIGAWLAGRRPFHLCARRVNFPLRRNFLSRLKYRWAIDGYIAISQAIRQTLIRGGVPDERIVVVPESVDLATFDAIEPLWAEFPPRQGRRFMCVAALTEEKGIDVLLQAFARHHRNHPESTLTIAGSGRLESWLKGLADGEGLGGAVAFLGFRPDFIAVMKCMDAVVMPSLSEGFGRAALYGMAAGLPVVASEVGGIPEMVLPGETGLLVPPGDPESLAAALDRLAADPESARTMGRRGRERVEARFNSQQMVNRSLELLHKLAGER